MVDHLQDGSYFAGELFAFRREADVAVIGIHVEESGADGSFKLGDLGDEEFGADAEVFGGVLEGGGHNGVVLR